MTVDLEDRGLNRCSNDVSAGSEFRGPILLKGAIDEQPSKNHQEKIEDCLRVPFFHWLILLAALFVCWRSVHFLQNGRFVIGALFILLGWSLRWIAVSLFSLSGLLPSAVSLVFRRASLRFWFRKCGLVFSSYPLHLKQ
jgi:hypothetical protein